MFAGDSSFGDDSMEMMEIMMLSTYAGRTLRLQSYIGAAAKSQNNKANLKRLSRKTQRRNRASPTGLVTIALRQSHSRGGHHQDCEVWRCTPGHHCTLDRHAGVSKTSLFVHQRWLIETKVHTIRVPHF